MIFSDYYYCFIRSGPEKEESPCTSRQITHSLLDVLFYHIREKSNVVIVENQKQDIVIMG